MRILNINTGYKTYSINGDENAAIRVRTTDFSIIDRLSKVKAHVGGIVEDMKRLKESDTVEAYLTAFAEADKRVKAELDAVFDSPVSAAVFGGMNCLSFAGGQPVALNFLEAIMPEIKRDLETEHSAAKEKIDAYTAAAQQFS